MIGGANSDFANVASPSSTGLSGSPSSQVPRKMSMTNGSSAVANFTQSPSMAASPLLRQGGGAAASPSPPDELLRAVVELYSKHYAPSVASRATTEILPLFAQSLQAAVPHPLSTEQITLLFLLASSAAVKAPLPASFYQSWSGQGLRLTGSSIGAIWKQEESSRNAATTNSNEQEQQLSSPSSSSFFFLDVTNFECSVPLFSATAAASNPQVVADFAVAASNAPRKEVTPTAPGAALSPHAWMWPSGTASWVVANALIGDPRAPPQPSDLVFSVLFQPVPPAASAVVVRPSSSSANSSSFLLLKSSLEVGAMIGGAVRSRESLCGTLEIPVVVCQSDTLSSSSTITASPHPPPSAGMMESRLRLSWAVCPSFLLTLLFRSSSLATTQRRGLPQQGTAQRDAVSDPVTQLRQRLLDDVLRELQRRFGSASSTVEENPDEQSNNNNNNKKGEESGGGARGTGGSSSSLQKWTGPNMFLARMTAWLLRYAPDRVADALVLDEDFGQNDARKEHATDLLTVKLGVEPDPHSFASQLERLLFLRDPSRLSEIPTLAKQSEGRESSVLTALEAKYKLRLQDCFAIEVPSQSSRTMMDGGAASFYPSSSDLGYGSIGGAVSTTTLFWESHTLKRKEGARIRLRKWFALQFPSRLPDVEPLLQHFFGREEELFRICTMVLGEEPSELLHGSSCVSKNTAETRDGAMEEGPPKNHAQRVQAQRATSFASRKAVLASPALRHMFLKSNNPFSEANNGGSNAVAAGGRPSPGKRFFGTSSFTNIGEGSGAAAQRGGAGARPTHFVRLVRFYRKYNPGKLSSVQQTLDQWDGKEELLFRSLVQKYGPEPDS